MRMVEASFPKHGERQMLLGTGVWCPEVDQEPNWEGSDATAKADSRRKGSRAEQPRRLALEDITCGPPIPQLHPGQLGPLENKRENQGFLRREPQAADTREPRKPGTAAPPSRHSTHPRWEQPEGLASPVLAHSTCPRHRREAGSPAQGRSAAMTT